MEKRKRKNEMKAGEKGEKFAVAKMDTRISFLVF